MIGTVVFGLSLLASATYFSYSCFGAAKDSESDLSSPEHPLLKGHSIIRSYITDQATYPAIRTFYHPHPHAEKLQAIADLPLLVFIHGLGGSLYQFAPLLGSLVNVAPCFGIDLPGHGLSGFAPTDDKAYRIDAFVALWRTAIQEVCQKQGHDKVVFIAHSMGCSLAALLSTDPSFSIKTGAIIAVCPKGVPPSRSEAISARRLLSLPDFVLDLLRYFDRRGGPESRSVKRFVGEAAGVDLKRLQLKFNQQFTTPVWKRSALGCLPRYDQAGQPHGGIPGPSTWRKVRVPLLLIAGEADTITKPSEVSEIVSCLQERPDQDVNGVRSRPALPGDKSPSSAREEDAAAATTPTVADDRRNRVSLPASREISSQHSAVVKTAILPAPAAHALMYDHSTYRTVAGLIEEFLARYVSPQLSLGWQLQQLTTSGKWDVKNLEKWKKVLPVSGPIGPGGLFRALKTLREQDEEHTPSVFLRKWKDSIFAIIDISHDSPVYDTQALERGGIQYHKFPTVSKVPPTPAEVADFIALVDRLRLEKPAGKAIGIHCHYGYNRTGFFIACYLVEREGYQVQDAIDEFARQKTPGIRHEHFIDTLFMRYHVGLKKVPVFKDAAS